MEFSSGTQAAPAYGADAPEVNINRAPERPTQPPIFKDKPGCIEQSADASREAVRQEFENAIAAHTGI
jgi:hypothetical protein